MNENDRDKSKEPSSGHAADRLREFERKRGLPPSQDIGEQDDSAGKNDPGKPVDEAPQSTDPKTHHDPPSQPKQD